MNKLTIIGNLTRDPELRQTNNGKDVCNFTVAVNRRGRRDQNSQPEADFFRVTAWNDLGKNCNTYLTKGKKVCVVGPVSVKTYQGNDGTTKANMEVMAEEVEFLTPKSEYVAENGTTPAQTATESAPAPSGFTPVDDADLPF